MELDVSLRANELGVSRSTLAISTGVLLTVVMHLALSGIYGYQRDELYFLACARHLAWGYVDQPPLIALISDVALKLFGDSLLALRLLPGLAAAALVGVAGRFTERLGGGIFAQSVAMAAVALSPFDFAVGNLLTMNAFEPLLWLTLTVLAYGQIDDPRRWRWAAIGAIVGIGFLNKWSMGIYAGALLGGMLLSPQRRRFAVPGLALAMAIAAAIAAPNIWWQAAHGWPQVHVLQNAERAKNEHVAPWLFMLEQLPLMNPFSAPLWLGGLWALLRSRRLSGIAYAYVLFVGFELVMHGKVYYVAPIYPALIAAGAVAFEAWSTRRRPVRSLVACSIVAGGLLIMPLATPTLPLPMLLAYQHAIDVRDVKIERHPTGLVPQQFADQLGWEQLESSVAGVVDTLPPGERAASAILTGDYGQAAALQFLGRKDALPPVISGHNEYWLWGPHGNHDVLVAVGVPRALLARAYGSITVAATYDSPYVLPQNNHLPIFICRDPRVPLVEFWPSLRRYI